MSIVTSTNRLVVVHNPHSSRAALIDELVFRRLQSAGYAYEVLEVIQASLEENVERLSPHIRDSDIILSAAGDGSAHAVAHAVMAAKKDNVSVGFLGFGNFNDLPRTFNTSHSLQDPVVFLETARREKLYPLRIFVNERFFRYALLYSTVGWTARAASQFDNPTTRAHVQSGHVGRLENLWRLWLFYLRTRTKSSLPQMHSESEKYTMMTDLLFVNSTVVAGLFRTKKAYYATRRFLYVALNVSQLVKNIPFLLRSLAGHMPGQERTNSTVHFKEAGRMLIQCDGEVSELTGVTSLRADKAPVPLDILRTN